MEECLPGQPRALQVMTVRLWVMTFLSSVAVLRIAAHAQSGALGIAVGRALGNRPGHSLRALASPPLEGA